MTDHEIKILTTQKLALEAECAKYKEQAHIAERNMRNAEREVQAMAAYNLAEYNKVRRLRDAIKQILDLTDDQEIQGICTKALDKTDVHPDTDDVKTNGVYAP